MSKKAATARRNSERDDLLCSWSDARGIRLAGLDEGQKWVVFAALGMMSALGDVLPLKRVMSYVLAHSGMGLGGTVIGAVVGVSDRSVRNARKLSPVELLKSVRTVAGGNNPAKLKAEHAGVVAKFLVEHPGARVKTILEFIKSDLGVTMDRLTLRRYLARYGLGCLRDGAHTDGPLFLERPSTGAHSP